MVLRLKEYRGEYKILVVSKSMDLTQIFLKKKMNVAYLEKDKFTIYPLNYKTRILESEKIYNALNEYDVIEIRNNGIIYKWFDQKEGEAGIATTSFCNSNCIMCPASNKERQANNYISIEQMETIITYFPNNLTHFTITGGEPTLIGEDNFIRLLKVVKNHMPNTTVLILSNGRTFGSKSFFEKIKKELPNHLRIAIPIHGSGAQKHDYITQATGGFYQTLRGIKNVLKANIELELRIVVSKLNCDDLINIAKLIIDYFPSVTIVNFIGLEMRGNCLINSEKVILSYEEAFATAKLAILLLAEKGISVSLYNFPYCMIEKEYWPLAQQSIASYKSNYYEECSNCVMKDICCGIFTTSMHFYKPTVYPILKGEMADD